MDDEWYNNPDWNEVTQADFMTKLSRASTHRAYYLKMKTAAISAKHPMEALDLCDLRIASGDDAEERASASYAKANIYARLGDVQNMFEALNDAIGDLGLELGAPAAGEYCCLVGFFQREDLFSRAIGILDALDGQAMEELGRPFNSFPTRAARALIDYQLGHKKRAQGTAKQALQLALDRNVPIAGMPSSNVIPQFPNTLFDKLLVVAGLWDSAELGASPEV